jgi:arylsulfatase A-like enzyme
VFDSLVGDAIKVLEERGELDNTIVVMTGDHGMPFPRCKSNNYDSGARVPLAIRWSSKVKAGTVVNAFVSLVDVAPTFYQAADLDVPSDVSGRSLLSLLAGKDKSDRSYVLHGKERHVPGQEGKDMGGYPTRVIRTHDFLYLHNFRPDRWPAGTPNYQKAAIKGAWLSDCDNGPTKTYMVENRDKDAHHRRFYELAFGKRPATELYDLKKDPDQLVNIAADSAYAETMKRLKAHLFAELKKTNDPRVTGKGRLRQVSLPWRSSEIPRPLTRDFKIMNSNSQTVWMKKCRTLVILCALAFLAPGSPLNADAARPNILIIFTDDQGYADMGCYGNKKNKTPRMDRLAKEGTRFTSFYAQSVCGPSRSALLTGRYPFRSKGWGMPASEITRVLHFFIQTV